MTFRRNRYHIKTTSLPDDDVLHDQFTPRKSAIKLPRYNTKIKEKKKVTWSDSVYITVDAETAYYAATQDTNNFAIVEDTQIPITLSCPARPNPNAKETIYLNMLLTLFVSILIVHLDC